MGTSLVGLARFLRPWMYLSVMSLHELEHGLLLAERTDRSKGRLLRIWLEQSVVPAFSDRIVPVDEAVASRAAALHVPDPAPYRDALIGATALVHGMTMVTRNVRGFDRFADLEVINPWN